MKITRKQLINLLTELTDEEIDSPIVVQARDVENVKHASKRRDEELLRMMKKRDLELFHMIKDLQSKLKEGSSKVRITRSQLRQLISEAMYDPGQASIDAMEKVRAVAGDEAVAKINKLYKAGEHESANELINSFIGAKFYPSDSFEDDVTQHRFNYVKMFIPDLHQHLTEEQMSSLFGVFQQDIRLGRDVNDGLQISSVTLGSVLIDTYVLYSIIDAAQKVGLAVSYEDAEEFVLQAIINMSMSTTVSLGLGEEIGITFYDGDYKPTPKFQPLVDSGKLKLVRGSY